jgi:hypothetical protein
MRIAENSNLINKTDMFIRKKLTEIPCRNLQLILVALAAVLAARLIYIQQGWINDDSVLYFEAARLFAAGQWDEAFHQFKWPLYSLLIAATHKLTAFDIHTSAQILSVIFFSIATASFLQIIRLAGGGNKELLSGALILFSSQYVVGDILSMLLRDQGFWAFFLTGIVFFIRFYRSRSHKDALLWQISIIIAVLFRIEAITYLAALPFMLLFHGEQPVSLRIKALIKANSLNILLAVPLGLIIFSGHLTIDHLGRLKEVFTINLYEQLIQTLHQRADIMASEVLGSFLDEFAVQGILLTFIFIILAKIASTSGWINLGLAIMALRSKNALLHEDAADILKVAMILAVINASLIITKVFVLSGRYVVAFSLLLMIFSSFYLAYIAKYLHATSKEERRKKWLLIALLVIMALGLVKNVLPKSEGHTYERDAVTWLKQQVTEEQSIFFVSARARFYAGVEYAGRSNDYWMSITQAIDNGSIYQYDYLFINMDNDYPEREIYLGNALENYELIKEFEARKATKKVMIFRKKPQL